MRTLLAPIAALTLLAALAAAPPAEAAKGQAKVKLVKAGSGAKAPLRYAMKAGTRDRMSMAMRMTMQLGADGQQMPAVAMPDIVFDVDVAVDSVDPKGVAKCSFTFGKVGAVDNKGDVQAEVVRQVDAMVAKMAGLKGHASITPRGEVTASGVDASSVKEPSLKQMIDSFEDSFAQATTPLPSEPVGLGAVWTATQSLDANGIALDQVATFELLARDKDSFTVKVSFDQKGKPQAMKMPGLPPGVKARLVKASGQGKGRSKIYFASLAPDSTLDLDMKVSVDIAMGGKKQAMDMTMATHVEVARKP